MYTTSLLDDKSLHETKSFALSNKTLGFQTINNLTVAPKENRRKKNQDSCCRMVKSVTKKSSLQKKKMFTVEETFNKQNSLCTVIQ